MHSRNFLRIRNRLTRSDGADRPTRDEYDSKLSSLEYRTFTRSRWEGLRRFRHC